MFLRSQNFTIIHNYLTWYFYKFFDTVAILFIHLNILNDLRWYFESSNNVPCRQIYIKDNEMFVKIS